MDLRSHRQKTHGAASELRRLCYPWHRWYDHDVLTHNAKGVYAVLSYACRLPEEPDAILQIPRWMFDPKFCATMRVAERPGVDCTTLRDLQRLIAERRGSASGSVVQPLASQSPEGDADGESPPKRSARTAGPVLRKSRRAAMARPERDDARRGGKAPRAATARGTPHRVRRPQRRRGRR
jgi:hypothetical protein